MALTERLQIIVTADAKGAASEFQKVGATADRELSRTEDRLRRTAAGLTSFGTQLGLAGGVATVGMFKLASAAGDYGEAVSAAGVIFGDASKDVEEFGKTASKTAALSRTAAVDAANTFGTFGKAAGLQGDALATFSTDLTQLAGDLASFRNTTPEEAILALGSALRGESEPLRRYGVLLDDATLRAKALELGIYDGNGVLTSQQKILAANAAIWEQTSDAQGDFLRTGDSLANQQRTLSAEFENLKIAVGEGAVPVFSELLEGANGLLGAFQGLDPGTQSLVGKIGAIGAVGATAAGGLSFLAGQALGAVDTFKNLNGRLRDSEGQLTRTGGALVGIGKAAAGITATAVAADVLFGVLNDSAGVAKKAEDAVNRLTVAIQESNGEDAFSAFADIVGAEQNTLRIQNLWQEFGAEIELVGTGVKADVEQVQRAFDSLSPEQAGAALDALERATGQLDKNSRQYQINTEFIERNRESLRLAADAASGVGDATRDATPTVDEFGNAIAGAGEEAKTAAELWGEYADAVKASTDPFFAVVDANNSLAEAQRKVNEAQAAYNAEATAENQQALTDANYAAVKAAQSQEVALVNLRSAVESGDVAVGDAVASLQRWRDQGLITQAQADLVALSFGEVDTKAKALDGRNVGMRVTWEEIVPEGSLLRRLVQGQSFFGDGNPSGRSRARRVFDAPRGTGGPVWPGSQFQVNERGAEMFVPNSHGFIMDASVSRDLVDGVRALVAGGGGTNSGPLIENYNVYGVENPQSPGQLVSDAKLVKALVG